MLKTVALQNILFPDGAEMAGYEALFYRDASSGEEAGGWALPDDLRWSFVVENGEIVRDGRPAGGRERTSAAESGSGVRYDGSEGCLVIPAGCTADLSCYFNMISAWKWLEYTHVENLVLTLDLSGDAIIDVVAYQLDDFTNAKQVDKFVQRRRRGEGEGMLRQIDLTSMSHSSHSPQRASLPVGHPDATLVGFAVRAKADVRLYGGAWMASVEDNCIRDIDLCIATTTFQKEDFIKRNVEAVKAALADDPEFAGHFQMIVVDNGRTLDAADLEDEHISVFGNVNAGGSGGFARGMIEALRAEKRPTHLIVMDDDVLILPESIKRTYALLALLRAEYHDCFISGAMLRLDCKDVQYEDIGYVKRDGCYLSKKGAHPLTAVVDCAFNEAGWPDFGHEYAAWWFCCIPMERVSEDSLPIPVFVRGDDVEFCLRDNARVLSLNGICVWHLGFASKFSAAIEYYQVIRNSFILQAFHPQCADVDFLFRCQALTTSLLAEFAYDYADVVLDAVEDFLDGPSVIEKPNGIDVLMAKAGRNEKLSPLPDVWRGSADFGALFDRGGLQRPDSVLRRKMVTYSHNGQLHLQPLVTDALGFTAYDLEYNHEPIFMKERLLSVNPNDVTATVRERNPERHAEVCRRREAVFARYQAEREPVERAYQEAYPRLTSIGFWKEYLGID